MHTKDVGNISEAKLISRFLELRYTVAVVFGDNARYDLIIDKAGILNKIQCKTGRIKGDNIVFNTASVSPFTNQSNYYYGEIDFFAVYCPDNDKCYMMRPSVVAKSKGRISLSNSGGKLTINANHCEI